MFKMISFACFLFVVLALPVRADLPRSFDWDDDAVCNLVRSSTDLHELAGASTDDLARVDRILTRGGDAESALRVLTQASDVDRFKILQKNDEQQDSRIRKVYDKLDDAGKKKLLDLVKSVGDVGT